MKDLVYHRSLLPAASTFADKTAVLDGSYAATFSEHVDRVLRLADGMRDELGIGRTDRYAVMALNSHQYLELYHAGFLGTGVINPLNLRLAPKELEFILQDSGTKVVFADAAFAPMVDKVRAEVGVKQIERVVLIGEGDVPHDVTFEDLVTAGRPDVPDEPEEDDPVILMYTGGTTGLPKGVVIDSRATMIDVYKIGARWPFTAEHVYLHQTPMFHAASFGGILVIPAIGGTTTFVGLFDPGQVLDVIERHQVTTTVMVPTMVQMVLDHPGFRPERMASMKVLTYGASPMPTALLQRLLQLFPNMDIFQGYGMTENCGLLTCLGPEEHRRGGDLLRSAGRPLPGSVVSIQDPDGNLLPAGETGEVCARSGNYMKEYWHRPEQTEAAFAGGWYHTGDAGYLDEQGYLYLVDRVKDMIVTGGENVYSAEVENAIGSHPAVAQIAVIGIPSEKWGEEVHAIVFCQPGATATEDELKEWARERIAAYKAPKSVEFRTDPLPLSGALKILKRELRAPYWAGKERAVQ
ncbi:MAG TPA: long-chain-fatty-acid--CoA ligase [Acidimicrobiales bacterium]|nr:long-chain-fatty-acid--CoA ligase [Acidimicrobiales bacterium]